MKQRTLWIGPAVLLAVLLGIWIARHLVRESVLMPTGYADAVHRNWLYAGERLLSRAGAAVQSVREFTELPLQLDGNDTLLLNTPGYALAPERIAALLAWVAEGGHLLCAAYQVYPSGEMSDPLWDALELQIETAESAVEPVAIRLNPQAPELRVEFRQPYRLRTANAAVLTGNPEQDGRLLRFDWGRGRVTVLSEFGIFSNDRLAEHDHVDLWWGLLDPVQRPGWIWLQYLPRVPSLAQLLWERAGRPLLAGLVTLLLAAWTWSGRLGPLLQERDEERRSLLEHIEAGGRFLWRRWAGGVLVEAVRQRLLQRLQRRHPQTRRLSEAARIEHLAGLMERPPEQVAAALQQPVADERTFTRLVRRLQDLGRRL